MPATIDRQKPMEERVSMTLEQPNTPYVEDKNRRAVIKKIAIGSAALAGCNLLPDKWTTPLIEFGALPAHATTSGLVEELVAAMEQAQTETEEKTAPQAETAKTETEEESEWTTVRWGGILMKPVIIEIEPGGQRSTAGNGPIGIVSFRCHDGLMMRRIALNFNSPTDLPST